MPEPPAQGRVNYPQKEAAAMPPKYMRIAEDLQAGIRSGKYAESTALPTEYEIAGLYAVSRQTVRQALAVLADGGYIEKRQGSGSYVRRMVPQAPAVPSMRFIAVVTTYISDYIFPSILREVETVFSHNHCTPTLYATQNQVYNERAILNSLLDNPPDGILVEGTKSALPNPNLDLYRELMHRNIPLVFMNGCYSGLPDALSVLDDNYGGGRMLVEYLNRKGHRNIGGIFKVDDLQGHQRYAGYADALRDLGLPMDDRRIFWYNTESDKDQLAVRCAQQLEGCTAVVCYNDEIASRLVVELQRNQIAVPEYLAVVSFDNSRYSDLPPIPISSLTHGSSNVGRQAAEMMLRLLKGEECRSEIIPWELAEKQSS